jgi:EAL domain-containing protein (putative c-di-GMP-specific phosphodiesterase class I)
MPSYAFADPPAVPVRAGRPRLDPDARAAAAQRRRMERELAASLRDGGLALQFLPRVSLQDAAEGARAAGAEATLRWPHRKHGIMPHASFMPLVEHSGQIVEIGGWALRTACAEAAAWRAGTTVTVGVAARQLTECVLLGQIAAALDSSGLPPECLDVALSEAMLHEVDTDTLLALSAVRDCGAGIALDDFGNGFASLAMLKRLPLTALKLDRALVRDLPGNVEDAAIARAAIETAHALGLRVVADGIENEMQRAFLTGAGCDEAQGSLFGRSLSPEQARERLGPR